MTLTLTEGPSRRTRIVAFAASPTPDVRCAFYLQRISARISLRHPAVPPFHPRQDDITAPEEDRSGEITPYTDEITHHQKKSKYSAPSAALSQIKNPMAKAPPKAPGTVPPKARRKAPPKAHAAATRKEAMGKN